MSRQRLPLPVQVLLFLLVTLLGAATVNLNNIELLALAVLNAVQSAIHPVQPPTVQVEDLDAAPRTGCRAA